MERWHSILFYTSKQFSAMAKTAKKSAKKTPKKAAKKTAKKAAKKSAKKSGPKDRSYVNKKQKYEVTYAPKRKKPAKKFAKRKKTS
jgi:hypothetical protein